MYVFGRHEAGTILHIVRNVAGTGTVSGVAGTITYSLRDESGNVQATGVTIAEQGSTGYYELTFTPDAEGVWLLSVTNPAGTDQSTTDYWIQVVLSSVGAVPSGSFLTTLANLKQQLDITGTHANLPDAYLNNVIARASHRCERIVGRALVSASYTEYVDGCGRFLNLRRGPITAVTSVNYVTYDSAAAETLEAVAAGDYFIRGIESDGWVLPGYLESYGSVFTNGQRNYKVIYTAGFTLVPYDLEQAALFAAVTFINTRKDAATSTRDVGSGAINFTLPGEADRSLREMLVPYLDLRAA